jgi:iron complex outermembrane recepter protein
MIVSLRNRLIASTALASLGVIATAHAQGTAPTATAARKASAATKDATATEQDDIIVVGVREALEIAAQRKRDSDTFVDSITATDIGAFPDKSVAEALQRVPGVTVARTSQGDATHYPAEPSVVIIRGLTQVRSEINGRDSFSASAGYGLNFADISPDLLSAVDTYKNQTADMIEGGIAGTVDLRTRLPFDQKGTTYSLTATANYGSLSKKVTPDISGLISTRFETDIGEFGFMVSGAYSKLDTISQGALLTRYVPFAAGVYGPGQTYIPNGFLETRTRYERERKGASAAFQWESPNHELLFTAQYNRSDYDNIANENSFTSYWAYVPPTTPQTQLFTDPTFIAPPKGGTPFSFFPNGAFKSGVITSSLGGGGYGFTDANGKYVPTSTNVFGVLPNGLPYIQPCTFTGNGGVPCRLGVPINTTTRYIGERRRIADASFNLKWSPSDRLTATVDYQHVAAHSRSDDTTFNLRTFANVDLNLDGEFPSVKLLAPSGYNTFGANPLSNSANYSPESIMDHITDSNGELDAFRGDVSYKVDSPWLEEIRVGGRYANRRQQHNWSAYNWQAIAADWTANPAQSYFVDSGPAYRPDGTILFQGYEPGFYETKSFGPNILSGNILSPSQFIFPTDAVTSNRDELVKRFSVQGETDQGGVASSFWNAICDRPQEAPGSCFTPGEMLSVSERTKSAYAMVKFGGPDANLFGSVNVRGNIGLRWVENTVRSGGATTFAEPFNAAARNCLPLTPVQAAALAQNPYLITPACLTAASTSDIAFSSGTFVTSTIETKHTNFLPSFNVRFDLDRNWLIRFAASRAISKPDIGLLKNFTIIQRDSLTQADIVRGNPQLVLDAQGRPVGYNFKYSAQITNPRLKPISANQFDLSVEYYSPTSGSFSATAFYKKFFDYIQNGTFVLPVSNAGVNRNVVAVGPVNGDGASIYGLELAYQRYFSFLPAPFDGLGVQLNVTRVWNSGVKNTNLIIETNPDGGGTATALSAQPGRINPGRLEQLSDYALNAVLLYEKGPVGMRVAYNWRSRYLDSVNDCCLGFPVWHTPEGFLDASLRFAVTRNIELNVQGSNLLATKIKTEAQVRGPTDTDPNQKSLFLPGSTFETDRRFLAGVRVKF